MAHCLRIHVVDEITYTLTVYSLCSFWESLMAAAEATDSSAFGWRCWVACCFYASEINSFLAFSPQSLSICLACDVCCGWVGTGRGRDSVMDRSRIFPRTRNNSTSPVLAKVKGAPVWGHFGYDEAQLLCSFAAAFRSLFMTWYKFRVCELGDTFTWASNKLCE